jgi:hypothetical protein
MSAHQLHRMLGITYKAAWFMGHRIRESLRDDTPPPMGGGNDPVEIDETYFGKKDGPLPTHGKTGRPYTKKSGATRHHKMAIVSMVSAGKSRSFHVDRASAESVRGLIDKHAHKDAPLHTDESHLYVTIGRERGNHTRLKHHAGEWVRGGATTNHVESFFGVFKRGMYGVYQHCTEAHLQRYLWEFDHRYNTRTKTDQERAAATFPAIVGKRLSYRQLVRRMPGNVDNKT